MLKSILHVCIMPNIYVQSHFNLLISVIEGTINLRASFLITHTCRLIGIISIGIIGTSIIAVIFIISIAHNHGINYQFMDCFCADRTHKFDRARPERTDDDTITEKSIKSVVPSASASQLLRAQSLSLSLASCLSSSLSR